MYLFIQGILLFQINKNDLPFLSGSALDLNFCDINVASLDKEFEEQENNTLGLSKQTLFETLNTIDLSVFCVFKLRN